LKTFRHTSEDINEGRYVSKGYLTLKGESPLSSIKIKASMKDLQI
jgi:hypothetical protein